ncbi:unnamed protein product [Caenorhabditis brenneri]
MPPSVNSTVKCFKGFSGDGRPFKQRLCQTEYCIKTTEPTGGATYGCDDFTPFCKVGLREERTRIEMRIMF